MLIFEKQNSDIRELITESRFYLHKIVDTANYCFTPIGYLLLFFLALSAIRLNA